MNKTVILKNFVLQTQKLLWGTTWWRNNIFFHRDLIGQKIRNDWHVGTMSYRWWGWNCSAISGYIFLRIKWYQLKCTNIFWSTQHTIIFHDNIYKQFVHQSLRNVSPLVFPQLMTVYDHKKLEEKAKVGQSHWSSTWWRPFGPWFTSPLSPSASLRSFRDVSRSLVRDAFDVSSA